MQIIAPHIQQHPADVCAVSLLEPLVGDGHITTDLALQHVAHFIQIDAVREIEDAFHAHERAVDERGLFLSGLFPAQQHIAVLHLPYDVVMRTADADGCFLFAMADTDDQIEHIR